MKSDRKQDAARKDRIYRNSMLILGILTTIFFIVSLVAAIEFPGAFGWLSVMMLLTAAAFLILRSVHKFRSTFRVNDKKKLSR
ncbi:MAG TPA: hypothetical protein VJ951_05685 [Bacteroidales bacterium]|nr:hypothetical protein [Bacteroidales bacterium]